METKEDIAPIKSDIDNPLSEIISLSADTVVSLDQRGNIVLFNKAAQKLFEYTEAEITGRPLETLLPVSAHNKHKGYLREFRRSENNSRKMGEREAVTGVSKSGREIFLDVSILKHPPSSALAFTAICRDLSESIEKEARLARKEEKFRALFNASHQLVILLDSDGVITDINETGIKLLGGDAKNYIGVKLKNCDFWLSENDTETISSALENVDLNSVCREIVSIRGYQKNEVILDVIVKKIVVLLGYENLIVVEGRDISERVKASKSLLESENRLSRAQRIANIGSWEWDIPSNKFKWSNEVYNIFEINRPDFGETFEAFLKQIPNPDRDQVEGAIIKSLNGEGLLSIKHKIVCSDGREKIVQEIGEVIRIKDGAPVRMEGTVQDVTEQWEKEQELIAAKNSAVKANHGKMQFLATMSHEFRTPLNAIIGFSTLIGNNSSDNENDLKSAEYAEYIYESGQHLLSLINDILDVSRLELDTVKLELSRFSFPALVRECVDIVSVKSLEKNIAIDVQAFDDLENVYLDHKLCKQIIINLLSNAVKFSVSESTVSIVVTHDKTNLKFSVIDNGVGLDSDDLFDIFEPFHQTKSSYISDYDGIGLGLTIVKKLTELQKGSISVSSVPDIETCFDVILPIVFPD